MLEQFLGRAYPDLAAGAGQTVRVIEDPRVGTIHLSAPEPGIGAAATPAPGCGESLRVRLGGTCAAGSTGGGITVPIGDPGDDEPDGGSADTNAGIEPLDADPAPAPEEEPAGDAAAAGSPEPVPAGDAAPAGWPDPVPAANPDIPAADAAEDAAPAPGAATDPATRSGPAGPVEPDAAAESVDTGEPVEEGAGPVDGRKGPSRRRVVDELPDWALSPAQRAKREKAREAARAAAQPRVPELVEHGPVEWHEAWREIEPTDLMVILARVDLARLDAAAVLDYVAAS
ncbi:hypothetical protein D477_011846, partial [Arthrobacter crystallopoietes BAB-32]